jgi:transcriptional regulator with XRE-family HTH domain
MDDASEKERFRTAFGAALDAQLGRRGLTQAALAERLGTTRSYLNQTMTGRKTPSPEWADKVADATALNDQERGDLHTAAAVAAGYKVSLPRKKVDRPPRTKRQ